MMMDRLLRIWLDNFLLSFIPIISRFFLWIIGSSDLIVIFSLTYPIQFVWSILLSIFSTGPNIDKEKNWNKNSVMSWIILWSVIALIIYWLFAWKIEWYISFMNLDINTYKIFSIYSVIQLFLAFELQLLLTKLYFEWNNKLANKYSIISNSLSFVFLIWTALLTKNQIIISACALIPNALFILYILFKNSNKFKFQINLLQWIKYDSSELFTKIALFLIYLFWLSNIFQFWPEYAAAIAFMSLITDTQWDMAMAVWTLAKVDISKDKFNYYEHRKNAFKYIFLLIASCIILFIALFRAYDIVFEIAIIYWIFDIIDFLFFPVNELKTCYLQIERSASKTTWNIFCSYGIRTLLSFLPTPFCTAIWQIANSIYEFIVFGYITKKKFKLNGDGTFVLIGKKEKK
jgi:hypothetical protein